MGIKDHQNNSTSRNKEIFCIVQLRNSFDSLIVHGLLNVIWIDRVALVKTEENATAGKGVLGGERWKNRWNVGASSSPAKDAAEDRQNYATDHLDIC